MAHKGKDAMPASDKPARTRERAVPAAGREVRTPRLKPRSGEDTPARLNVETGAGGPAEPAANTPAEGDTQDHGDPSDPVAATLRRLAEFETVGGILLDRRRLWATVLDHEDRLQRLEQPPRGRPRAQVADAVILLGRRVAELFDLVEVGMMTFGQAKREMNAAVGKLIGAHIKSQTPAPDEAAAVRAIKSKRKSSSKP